MGRHREFDPDKALEAVLSVFWQKGYEGTSVEDLTRTTGVARPGLYAALGNKETLFRKALDLYEETYIAFMLQALDEPTAYRAVERILRGSAELHTLYPRHPGCMGLNGALACSEATEPIRTELANRRAATQSALSLRLERARDEGDLPGSADCEALAAFVMAITQGMAVQAKGGATRDMLDRLVDQVLATWPSGER